MDEEFKNEIAFQDSNESVGNTLVSGLQTATN